MKPIAILLTGNHRIGLKKSIRSKAAIRRNVAEESGKMHPQKICKFCLFTAGLIPAVFLTVSCQCVEDWLDKDKPLPKTGITSTPQSNSQVYSIDEAAALFCNQLIMKFSMYYNGKPYLLWDTNDRMIRKVAMQLYRDNVVSQWKNNSTEQCLIKTVKYSGCEWHLAASDKKTGQILLSLSLPMKARQQ